MKGFKLVRKMKDGSLAPLFINKRQRLPIGEWLEAELHATKGFAVRKGWHCTFSKNAPHLSKKNRGWVEVELDGCEIYKRPKSQGGKWILAQRVKIIKECKINQPAPHQ